jgi:tetratricopeptide (TPR) repeat protein
VRDRAATDPAFGRAFSLREEMEAFPRRAEQRRALTETLMAVQDDFFQENTPEKIAAPQMTAKINRGRWLAIAASLALLVAAVWFFSQPGMPEYRQYAQHAPLSLTVRGVSDQNISAAEKAFAAKDYAGALTALDQVLAQDPVNTTAQLYKGICLLELDRATEARTAWRSLTTGNTALKSEAQWYTALSYLKEHNFEGCQTVLQAIDAGAERYEDARKLLRKFP